jgi:hypothetical protein
MMAGDDFEKRMKQAEPFQKEFRNIADMLEGCVSELMRNGWTDRESREIVASMFRVQT